jgi:hypothetical protein
MSSYLVSSEIELLRLIATSDTTATTKITSGSRTVAKTLDAKGTPEHAR